MSYIYHWELFSNYIVMSVVSALLISVIAFVINKVSYKCPEDNINETKGGK